MHVEADWYVVCDGCGFRARARGESSAIPPHYALGRRMANEGQCIGAHQASSFKMEPTTINSLALGDWMVDRAGNVGHVVALTENAIRLRVIGRLKLVEPPYERPYLWSQVCPLGEVRDGE